MPSREEQREGAPVAFAVADPPSAREPLLPRNCRHCGLTIPARRLRDGDTFCCDGCRRVYDLIHESGLERYYEMGRREAGPPATLKPDAFTWLEPLLESDAGDPWKPRRLTLDVQGIHCAACVWLLRELFLRRRGAIDLRLNPSLGKAEFTWVPAQADLAGYLAEAEGFGYRFGPDRKGSGSTSPGILIRMGLSAAAAMNVMIFSICFYAGLGPQDGALYVLFGRLNLGLTLFAVLAGGWIFFRSAWQGIRRGIVHLDLPIALSMLLAFAGSVYAHLTEGPRAAYFDTVAVFVTLMLVGRWLQERMLERNRNSLLASEGIENLHVRRIREGRLELVPVRRLDRGDEIRVVPGDLVPVESIVLHRPASVALDWITGESEVRTFAPGESVPAGALNAAETTASLAANESFAESGLHGLMGATDESERSVHAGGDRWWHRVGTVYVTVVLALAAAGFLLWIGQGPGRALKVTVSILAVTCPCALGLAIPLARELAHAGLRRHGVFLRRGSFLDRALRLRKIVFDKTGTLTCGRLVLDEPSRARLRGLSPEERSVLGLLVRQSNHPVSRSLAAALAADGPLPPDAGSPPPDGSAAPQPDGSTAPPSAPTASPFGSAAPPPDERTIEVREVTGRGLEATIGGRKWRLGRPERPASAGDPPAPGGPPDLPRTELSADGRAIAVFSFLEEIRPDAAEEVRRLRARGLEVFLWSGDSPDRTRAAAAELGIPEGRFAGGLDPRGKAARLRELDREDTMMIGDGLNDAPSFAEALCTATPAVDRPALPARADLYFLGEGVGAVRLALEVAGRLRSVIRGNLAFAVAYNLAALTLSFLGRIDPLVAAVLMPASSVLVVGHTAWRLSGRRLAWTS